MKNLSILFFSVLLAYSCGSGEQSSDSADASANGTMNPQMVPSDLKNNNLLGAIKSFEETPYTVDENGNMGEIDSCCISLEEYDEKGFRIRYTDKNREGEITETGAFEYDDMGRFMKYIRTANGKEAFKRIMKRDDKGNPLEAVDSDSTLQVTRVHKVDNSNEYFQALSGKTYMEDGTYVGTWAFDYVDGMRVGNSWVDSTGVDRVKRAGELNDKGWMSKMVDVRIEENGDTVTTVETFIYDSMDEKGNWTKRTKFENDKAVEILTRSYTYYE